MTIYIGNLSWDCEQEDLHSLFAEYGAVKKCSLPLDRETGRKRGFGFVDMANEAEAIGVAAGSAVPSAQSARLPEDFVVQRSPLRTNGANSS